MSEGGEPTEREFLEGLRYEDKFPDEGGEAWNHEAAYALWIQGSYPSQRAAFNAVIAALDAVRCAQGRGTDAPERSQQGEDMSEFVAWVADDGDDAPLSLDDVRQAARALAARSPQGEDHVPTAFEVHMQPRLAHRRAEGLRAQGEDHEAVARVLESVLGRIDTEEAAANAVEAVCRALGYRPGAALSPGGGTEPDTAKARDALLTVGERVMTFGGFQRTPRGEFWVSRDDVIRLVEELLAGFSVDAGKPGELLDGETK